MKKFYLALSLVTALVTIRILVDGKEFVCSEAVAGDTIVCVAVENDACYDPVTKRWEPCF